MNKLLLAIKHDLTVAMKREVELRKDGITSGSTFDNAVAHKTVSRAIISMIPEINIKPQDATNDHIYKLLKKFIGQQKERQIYIDKHITESDIVGITPYGIKKLVAKKIQDLGDNLTSSQIEIAQKYLPKGPTEEELVTWITDNIDFSKFKNNIQAMGPIMKQFKGCDGNFIKNVLLKL